MEAGTKEEAQAMGGQMGSSRGLFQRLNANLTLNLNLNSIMVLQQCMPAMLL